MPAESVARRAALASLVATSFEWYDFFLYATAAALVFPVVFFPDSSPRIGLVLAFGTFAFGFIARPLGGILFGHFGDRTGRKRALVYALALMGVSSTLIGALPGYATIGVAAPVLLVLLRIAQGIAIGGQWGGAILLATENAPAARRGYYGAFAQAGAPAGLILANLAFIVASSSLSNEAFVSWGWRIPFLLSFVLIVAAVYLHARVEDTQAFKVLESSRPASGHAGKKSGTRIPALEALRRYPRTIALAAGTFLVINVTFYVLIVFVLAYGASADGPGFSRGEMLLAVLLGTCIQLPAQFWAAAHSDRHGRRRIYMAGAVLTGAWAFVLFPLVDLGNLWAAVLGIGVGLVFLSLMYGPQAALFSELFPTEVRYSGASLGYQLGSILGGALAPTIAALLWVEFGVRWVSVYVAAAAIVSFASVSLLAETYRNKLHDAG